MVSEAKCALCGLAVLSSRQIWQNVGKAADARKDAFFYCVAIVTSDGWILLKLFSEILSFKAP